MTLADQLTDWTDIDVAEHALAICIGIAESESVFNEAKARYWSNNTTGNALAACLNTLADAGILESRKEPDIQFRWAESSKE